LDIFCATYILNALVPRGEAHREVLSHPAQQHLLCDIPQPFVKHTEINPSSKRRYHPRVLKPSQRFAADVLYSLSFGAHFGPAVPHRE
jgi:hypothetical protein